MSNKNTNNNLKHKVKLLNIVKRIQNIKNKFIIF